MSRLAREHLGPKGLFSHVRLHPSLEYFSEQLPDGTSLSAAVTHLLVGLCRGQEKGRGIKNGGK